MQSQLERAYDLIKQGREPVAIEIIEAIIKLEPDNDDAWWLLANASKDTQTQKNALEAVLDIGTNPIREAKATEMLRVLEQHSPINQAQDEFDDSEFYFASDEPVVSAPRRKPALKSEHEVVRDERRDSRVEKRSRRRGGGCGGCIAGCFRMGCMAIILLAICGGLIGFGISRTAGNVFELPQEYGVQGALAFEEPQSVLIGADQTHYWTYDGTAGTTLKLHITSDSGDIAPPLILFSPSGEFLTTINSFSFGDSTENRLSYTLKEDGLHVIVVPAFAGLAEGTYTLEVVD